MTPDPQLRDVARRCTDIWCSQDPASVAAHHAPEGSVTINGGSPSLGRAAITDAARSFMDAYPDREDAGRAEPKPAHRARLGAGVAIGLAAKVCSIRSSAGGTRRRSKISRASATSGANSVGRSCSASHSARSRSAMAIQ